MQTWTLIIRSLRFYYRSHLGVLLGAAVGSTILVGALAVGDSVRWSLRKLALERLGGVQFAMPSNDRYFQEQLAQDIASDLSIAVAPALQLIGAASRPDAVARANRVQVLGVDDRFSTFCKDKVVSFNISADGVFINTRLAEQLNVQRGDIILLRAPKPSPLSRDAPISPQEDASSVLRLRIENVLSGSELGNFSLQANQAPPYNAFVRLSRLQEQLELGQRANLMLAGGGQADLARLTAALAENWQLADAQLELRLLPEAGALELRTSRVFLESPIAEAAIDAVPGANRILTYLVNRLAVGDHSTPYSMVTAAGPPIVPANTADDKIIINQWLADDLQAKPGDRLRMQYYVVGLMRLLEERQAEFEIGAVAPMNSPAVDRDLMPDFPGLTEADNCRDWDAGFAIQTGQIRPKDEKYWADYRGTPKAFVTIAQGQRLWTNRFGELTAVRYPLSGVSSNRLAEHLQRAIDPARLGLSFVPVQARGLRASALSQDFGQLFLGFSFFLFGAALLLMMMLFQFGVEQRTTEVGTLLALGFHPGKVRLLLLSEGAALALAGGVLGIAGGIGYARVMLHGLGTIWRDAVSTSALGFHAGVTTLIAGALAGALAALLAIWLILRKQARSSVHQLLAAGAELELSAAMSQQTKPSSGMWIATVSGIAGTLVIGIGALWPQTAAGAFFCAGALLLIAGLGVASALLGAMSHSETATRLTVQLMSMRNAARRPKRSIATVALLACGCFLVAAVGAFRLDPPHDWQVRRSGTGGFALIGESALPIFHDLNSEDGRQFWGLDNQNLAGVEVVPIRVREGDEASCLNLNRAQTPRLLGAQPELLQYRQSFAFAQVSKGLPKAKQWLLLNEIYSDGAIPAIGDQASIVWAMGKKVGDTIDFTDERGRVFKARIVASLANSILQGNLLISEKNFIGRFPSDSGYRMFLVDTPDDKVKSVSETLSSALIDVGLELTPTARRLAAFNAVQNTYLSAFQALGGLGLLLGSMGLGVVVMRNVFERRGELALLAAVGFRKRALTSLVLSEHSALLLMGLAIGVVSAAIAVLPAIIGMSWQWPASLVLTLLGVLISGLAWTWIATRMALRGQLLQALRNE